MVAVATPGEKMQHLRMSRRPGLTQTELAQALGVTRYKVANWETNRSEVPRPLVVKAAKLFNVPEDWFWDGADLPPDSPALQSIEVGKPLYPVAGVYAEIALGPPVPAGSWADPEGTEEMIEVPGFLVLRGRFACIAQGESMLPLIEQGDLLIFQRNPTPRPGTIVLARNGQNQVTVKTLRVIDNRYVLQSINPAYEDAVADYIEHVGMLVAIWKQDGPNRGTLVYDDGGIRP
jgi:SOS-response transcriptional repressor LexA